MGYESRIIVAERNEYSTATYGTELCRIDLSTMGFEEVDGKQFYDIFTNDIDFPIYTSGIEYDENDEDAYKKDKYGKICQWATLDTVIDWLSKSKTEYRRQDLLLSVLKGVKENVGKFEQVCVIHFGY